MSVRAFFCILLSLMTLGCANGRGDLIDNALDSSLYKADTKAERLLRYFEIQALLVRFAANTSGSTADRNAVAVANIAANDQLTSLVACLYLGSAGSLQDNSTGELNANALTRLMAASPNDPVRSNNSYCSFFESRALDYEEALFSMLRQVVRNDPDAKLLETMIQGPNVLDFASIVSNLIQLASRVIQDELVLQAFRDDATELRYFIYQNNIGAPSQISANCTDQNPPNCAIPDTSTAGIQPIILVWHFQEVEAYMKMACQALNGDVPAVKTGTSGVPSSVNNTYCSANLPFSIPSAATVSLGSPPPTHVAPSSPNLSAAQAKLCKQIATDNATIVAQQAVLDDPKATPAAKTDAQGKKDASASDIQSMKARLKGAVCPS